MPRRSATRNPKDVATLSMVVEYERIPSDEELRDLLDKAREIGGVSSAIFELHVPVKRDLRNEL